MIVMCLIVLALASQISALDYWKDTNQQPFSKSTKSKSVQWNFTFLIIQSVLG
jgi:hypothetical protein